MTEIEAKKEFKERLELIEKCYRGEVEDYKQALELGVKALEKQIPKKPRFYAHNYYCSVCDSLVGNNEFEWKRFKYCDTCGQKMNWESDEE